MSFTTRVGRTLAMLTVLVLSSGPACGIDVVFDYRFDVDGMFADPTRRAALEAAASAYERFTDELTAIQPSVDNTWSVDVSRPIYGTSVLDDLTVPANSITVFIIGYETVPGVLGWARHDPPTISGDAAWQQTVNGRGQEGALLSTPTDYAPWGGTIVFNANPAVNWHFDPNTDPAAGQQDFLTTAMHEIGHILGFGEAPSWYAQVEGTSQDGYRFAGHESTALYGQTVPLDRYASHWAEGTMSYVDGIAQETAMDPSTPRGQRQWMTDLDYTGFAGIGWQVPEPASTALVGLAALALGLRRRKRLLPA